MIIKPIVYVFTDPKTRLGAIVYPILIFLILAIPSGLVPNQIIPYTRMTPTNILDYFFVLTTAVLASVYILLPETKACDMDNKAFLGGFAGFLAFACPTCNFLLVGLLGFNTVLNTFDPLRPFIGLLSIVILLYSINKKWEKKTK